MEKTIELTEIGQNRIKVLYGFLDEKGIKELYLQRADESVHPRFNRNGLNKIANDSDCPQQFFFMWGFYWEGTPEGDEHWYGLDLEYRRFYETLNNQNHDTI